MSDADYREWPTGLSGAVVWSRTDASAGGSVDAAAAPVRVLPDGCLDILRTPTGLIVAGPDTSAQLVPARPGARYLGLRLPPGVGPAVVGVPALELRDRRVPLADLWGHAAADRLERRLAEVPPTAAGTVLVAAAAERLAQVEAGGSAGRLRPDRQLEAVARLLRRGWRVGAAAEAVGLGERGLHRRSLIAFGYGPKTLARILRLGRALDLARTGVPAAEVAATTGYADQPHLAREVRALTGVTLRELLGRTPLGEGQNT